MYVTEENFSPIFEIMTYHLSLSLGRDHNTKTTRYWGKVLLANNDNEITFHPLNMAYQLISFSAFTFPRMSPSIWKQILELSKFAVTVYLLLHSFFTYISKLCFQEKFTNYRCITHKLTKICGVSKLLPKSPKHIPR
jgi:hypothetical protein